MTKKVLFGVLFLFSTLIYAQKEIYELRVYDLKFGTSAKTLYNYLDQALIKALNRSQIYNIGIFEVMSDVLPKKIYVFIPYTNINQYYQIHEGLKNDKDYELAAKDYMETSLQDFPYSRYDTSLFIAFDGLPIMTKPSEGSSVFELRTYEGYSEDALRRKMKMFNENELKIFDEVGLHAVFFGEKIAGSQMPCLTYMLAFKDMKERDDNWKKFGSHPEWQRISKLEEFQNSVSNISNIFLKPMDLSKL